MQVFVYAFGDDRADVGRGRQLLDARGLQGLHRAESLGQHRSHPTADVTNRKGVQQPSQAARLALGDFGQQVLGTFLTHPFQIGELFDVSR